VQVEFGCYCSQVLMQGLEESLSCNMIAFQEVQTVFGLSLAGRTQL